MVTAAADFGVSSTRRRDFTPPMVTLPRVPFSAGIPSSCLPGKLPRRFCHGTFGGRALVAAEDEGMTGDIVRGERCAVEEEATPAQRVTEEEGAGDEASEAER